VEWEVRLLKALETFKVKTLGCHPNWPEGVSFATPLQNPRLFNCALSLNRDGHVSDTTVIAAKSRHVAVPFVRVTTRAKKRAVFHLSSSGIFKT